ncbi:putative serine protease K12H4.7 [Sitophilus oryzae]|uniref:Serine protease K12H4.7 n=1 Tax=Sitophilus oryzae TaxID=7048 RepID=A0A6J2Y0H1_SITOR|nr:putative serine protease K12H4.7 [Sitophilus oryzae]
MCRGKPFVVTSFLFFTIFFDSFPESEGFLGVRKQNLNLLTDLVPLEQGNVSTLFYEQKLDHFTTGEARTWKQRYHVSEDYVSETRNRAYLYLGGESSLRSTCASSGAWIEHIKEYGGLVVCLEHRYYGESQPLENLSTENLKYLSSTQALEDAATFIQFINTQYNLTSDVKWIVYGASYSGSLAAWLRLKYPHLVAGAVSHSGPLEAVLEFKEYLQVVLDDFASHSTQCLTNIKAAFTELEEVVSSCLEDSEIYNYVDEVLTLCDSIEQSEGNDKDLASFFEVLADDNFAYVAQYNKNPSLGNLTVDFVCDIMVDESIGTVVDRLGKVNTAVLNKTGSECLDYTYTSMITQYTNVTADPSSMMRQWFYQTCTEFGFFQTSAQDDPVFGSRFDIDFFVETCQDLFGTEFNESLITAGINQVNTRYGATNIKASNVVYVHGSMDPWHVLGKLEDDNEVGSKAIVIQGLSHCAGYYTARANDSDDLINARAEVHKLVGEWLTGESTSSGFKTTSFSLFVIILISIYAMIV